MKGFLGLGGRGLLLAVFRVSFVVPLGCLFRAFSFRVLRSARPPLLGLPGGSFLSAVPCCLRVRVSFLVVLRGRLFSARARE